MSYSARSSSSSSSVRSLYRQYSSASSASENLPPRTLARVARELRNLHKNPPQGVRLIVDGPDNSSSSSQATTSSAATASAGDPSASASSALAAASSSSSSWMANTNLDQVLCELQGPTETPYEGRYFVLKLTFSQDFPAAPPRGFFLTKIYHPNVDPTTGAICVNTLKKDWTAETTLSHVLAVIRCLLIVPFPESSLNEEAGKLFMESYQEYANRARIMAQVHGRTYLHHQHDLMDVAKEEEPLTEDFNTNNHGGNTGDAAAAQRIVKSSSSSSTGNGVMGTSCAVTSGTSTNSATTTTTTTTNPLRSSDNNKKVTKASGAKMSKKKSLKRL